MFWRDRRVLVTGGAGVIGRELISLLSGSKAAVLCVDRKLKPEWLPLGVRYCHNDIASMNMKDVRRFNPEIIFHLAASFERTVETLAIYGVNFKDNIIVSHRVFDLARGLKSLKKLVFASSYLIYSPDLYLFRMPNNIPVCLKEADLIDTRNLVGAAKYYAENELDFLKQYVDFTVLSARIFRVYGRGSRDIISRWVRMGLAGEQIRVFKDRNMFDYIYAEDVAVGLIKLAQRARNNEIFNLGSGLGHSVKEVICIIRSFIPQLESSIIAEPGLFEASCADMEKFEKIVKWRPKTALNKGIKRIFEYEKGLIS